MLKKLTVTNFRNLERLTVDFSRTANLFIGNNSQGKTNLLEAIYFLAVGRSFRSERRALINWRSEHARLTAVTDKETIEAFLDREGGCKILINGKRKSLLGVIGRLVLVLFHAPDLEIVYGPPQLRRSYLDRLISTVDRGYLHALVSYQTCLRSKNKLLKVGASNAELEVWNKNLASLGSFIWSVREEQVASLSQILKTEAQRIFGKAVYLDYKTPLTTKGRKEKTEEYLHLLAKLGPREKLLKVCLVGPHLDDYQFILEVAEARNLFQKSLSAFGSRGEQRAAAIALKLAESKIFGKHFGVPPTILLDDIASELDHKNRELLFHNLPPTQLLITATDASSFPDEISRTAKIFEIDGGKII